MAFAEGRTTEQGKQPYKYGGKELDQSHGLNQYDVSARYYDPGYGRFTTGDPLSEKYYNISPYVYVGNNPMRFIDPTGKDWIDFLYGVVDGVVSNFTVGASDVVGGNRQTDVSNASHYNSGRTVADVISIGGGLVEMGSGGTAAGAGVVVTAGTGGTASVASVPLAVGGVAIAAHGTGVITKALQKDGRMSEKSPTGSSLEGVGSRRKNRLSDKGEPNSVQTNKSNTTKKKYGPDGNVQKEWNKGHPEDTNSKGKNDHIHDYKPNKFNPKGRGDRQPARDKYNNNDKRDFELD